MEKDKIAAVAEAAARKAGAIQNENYGKLLNVDGAMRHDIKLEVDRLCEAAIVGEIRGSFPDHSILAEEGGRDESSGEYIWIIDPLDGTVNYFYGLPYFCTSVACYKNIRCDAENSIGVSLSEPVAGVVYAPRADEMFIGIAGEGAKMNGCPIRASQTETLEDSIVAMGFGSTREKIQRMHERIRRLSEEVRKIRILGAAAYDMANVAAGRATCFIERGLKIWDIAAGKIIIEEAGGKVDCREFSVNAWDILASGSQVHEKFAEIIRGMEADE